MSRAVIALLASAIAFVAGGCGGSSGPAERANPPAKPPVGWRTVSNGQAGLTFAAPKDWTVRTRRGATLIRSPDKLVVATFAADRGEEGRDTPPARYAEETLQGLPDFEGSFSARSRRVRGSPYPSARIDGGGTVAATRRAQRITLAAFQRPGIVTYAAVVFSNAEASSGADEVVIAGILRSLRG